MFLILQTPISAPIDCTNSFFLQKIEGCFSKIIHWKNKTFDPVINKSMYTLRAVFTGMFQAFEKLPIPIMFFLVLAMFSLYLFSLEIKKNMLDF